MNYPDLDLALADFVGLVDWDSIAKAIQLKIGGELSAVRAQLETYVGEVHVARRVVGPFLRPGLRVLELGSGIGLFSAFLADLGVDITELEPAGSGFEFIAVARSCLAGALARPPQLDMVAEALSPDIGQNFDLIFSLNVLEHVTDWRLALEAALSVLAPNGTMVHMHPNYTFPYEPHFGLPLIPGRPGSTARLLPAAVSRSSVWISLNWITARQIRGWCASRELDVEFKEGVLWDSLGRTLTDPEFGKRHGSVIRFLARTSQRLRLGNLLRRLPPAFVSPVRYTIRRRQE
ncbi:MAG: class I SAM-dependent methyltransferase [Ilumatobacteraceae bacterium]